VGVYGFKKEIIAFNFLFGKPKSCSYLGWTVLLPKKGLIAIKDIHLPWVGQLHCSKFPNWILKLSKDCNSPFSWTIFGILNFPKLSLSLYSLPIPLTVHKDLALTRV
jgi:hypothetical protein